MAFAVPAPLPVSGMRELRSAIALLKARGLRASAQW